jgi:integrase/recombinase XerD
MSIKKIRKPIRETEFKKLMNHLRGDNSLKEFNRIRFLRIFSLLYYSGCRLNELSQITVKQIKQILETKETTIISHKVKGERILYFSDSAIKEISKYFILEDQDENNLVITSWGKPKQQLHHISLIQSVNKYIQSVLGDQYSSHSFRSGIITDMATKSVNPKIIQSYIGHKNISTTLSYVKPSEADIKNALVR